MEICRFEIDKIAYLYRGSEICRFEIDKYKYIREDRI